jgi:hypothetical protein
MTRYRLKQVEKINVSRCLLSCENCRWKRRIRDPIGWNWLVVIYNQYDCVWLMLIPRHVSGLLQTLKFPCAEPNANELKQRT